MDFRPEDADRFRLAPGDVLVCEGGEVGRAAIWEGQLAECYFQKAIHRVRTSKALSPEYLRYLLEHYARTRAFAHFTSGSTIAHLPQEDLRNLPVNLPPHAEQRRIVSAIEEQFSRLDAGVAALARAHQNLKRMRAALLRDQLSHPGDPEVSINEIATAIQYGYTAKATASHTGPKMLRITDIQDGSVNWDTVPHCVINRSNIAKFQLAPGDLVFARTGATVGKSFLIQNVPEAVFASYLIRLRFLESIVSAYIALFFQSENYWRQILEGSLGIGQPNVNATTLGRITLRLPAEHEQERTVLAMSEIDHDLTRTTAIINHQNRRAQSLRSSILAAAFFGELVPQNPADEPASSLLERTAAERASSNGHKPGRAGRSRISREVSA
jgi:type I restriction enzyme S subunit